MWLREEVADLNLEPELELELQLTSIDEFIKGFQVFDKAGNGFIGAGELRYVLTQLGEKMSDEEVDELLKGFPVQYVLSSLYPLSANSHLSPYPSHRHHRISASTIVIRLRRLSLVNLSVLSIGCLPAMRSGRRSAGARPLLSSRFWVHVLRRNV